MGGPCWWGTLCEGLGERERWHKLVVPKPLCDDLNGPYLELWYCLSPVGEGERAGLVEADHDPIKSNECWYLKKALKNKQSIWRSYNTEMYKSVSLTIKM